MEIKALDKDLNELFVGDRIEYNGKCGIITDIHVGSPVIASFIYADFDDGKETRIWFGYHDKIKKSIIIYLKKKFKRILIKRK